MGRGGRRSSHPGAQAIRRAGWTNCRHAVAVLSLVLAALVAVGAGGCASAAPKGTGGSGGAAGPPPATVAALATRLTQAVQSGDRGSFDALFAYTDEVSVDSTPTDAPSPVPTAAPGRRDLLWSNLRALASVEFQPGPDADTLRVGWTVGLQDVAPAWQLVGGVVCDASACGLRNLAPVTGSPAPLWAVQAITVSTDPAGVAVVGGAGDTPWLAAARQAVAAVAGADLSGLDDPSATAPKLVVEVPDTFTAFQAIVGQDSADFTETGAFTWVEDSGAPAPGSTPSPGGGWQAPGAAVRVVVNPSATTGLDASQQAALLAHEAVHVATIGHPVATGQRWVSEGMAEIVALGLDAGMAAQSTGAAAAACTSAGLAPPTDASFGGGDAISQQTSYAVAWQLLTLLRGAQSPAQAEQSIVALWDDAPSSAGVLADLAAWSAAWCAAR